MKELPLFSTGVDWCRPGPPSALNLRRPLQSVPSSFARVTTNYLGSCQSTTPPPLCHPPCEQPPPGLLRHWIIRTVVLDRSSRSSNAERGYSLDG
ncbi:hypothetical protein J6590_029205 [Homalodisca vitripennis]|nr:hypothetical protein J6590_029205 [Homalodisca vitripennis]